MRPDDRKAALLSRIAAQRAGFARTAGIVSDYLRLLGRLQALWRRLFS
jgi:hypothetical protein